MALAIWTEVQGPSIFLDLHGSIILAVSISDVQRRLLSPGRWRPSGAREVLHMALAIWTEVQDVIIFLDVHGSIILLAVSISDVQRRLLSPERRRPSGARL